ncbi:MAG: PEP-CTERM sorting domain-containing protein [Planctomycetes bacterium]|nr:PEP-CTERM sorting domain-containing protein [Planctomycetota bacterium]
MTRAYGVGLIGWGVLLVLGARSTAVADLWTAGHGDLGPEIVKGTGEAADEVHLHLHLHKGAVVGGQELSDDGEFALGDVTVHVPRIAGSTYVNSYGSSAALWLVGQDQGTVASQSLQTRLGLPEYAFFWNLPDDAGLGGDYPFLGYGYHEEGWGTSDLKAKLTLVAFTGPVGGEFVLWRSGPKLVHMQTSDGISEATDFLEFTTDHGHANWSFSKVGAYTLTIRSDAYVLNGSVWDWIGSDQGTLNFQVVPEPSSLVLVGIGLGGCLLAGVVRGRRARRVARQKA